MTKLTEQEHGKYLERFLSLVRDVKKLGHEEFLSRIASPIQESLDIARDVGYRELARNYQTLFLQEGLVLRS